MAKQQGKVYLGYEEEVIGDKNQTLLNYTVNKIGGFPDWPPVENLQLSSKCPLCGLHRLLVVQCYAPLENSVYHRTLYVFACISPNCWIQSESWLCVRSQFQDNSSSQSSTTVVMPSTESNMMWCNGADEWDENDNGDTANGNVMNVDNASPKNGMQRNSDEDEESNSFELETVEQALGNLQVFDAHNANMSPVQGAVGAIGAPVAAAELEGGDEPGLVTVDTPTAPGNDVEALLQQTAELPPDLRSRLMCAPLQFLPKFIYVEEEWRKHSNNDDRVTELLNKYKRENAEIEACGGGDRAGGGGSEDEPYEDAAPLHGDKLFHAFLTRLRNNPGQILRYSREQPPLLGAPLPSAAGSPGAAAAPSACARCGARLACELQLVPEFAETLRVAPTNIALSHLHFLSVLIFTCSQSCWQPNDTLVQETVVFQQEVV
ncbi:programmed cell death protein 2-like [Pectinophora gossypiella]|uniref:programmed cell death protein 2-like n=1 Tax=Pectinophora gossypiella TaxID=13191 RepID=UPI00214E8A2A|nr:programmed cell death protein 2-like [Pectinophora gossypiella]